VQEVSSRFRLAVPPDALVQDLPVGVQQRAEIVKALTRDAKILILDEPTAVLTPPEIDELMAVIRRLKESGTSVVFITHKLKEVQAVADTVTVIRRGRVVGTAAPQTSEQELASMMVGRSVQLTVDKGIARPGATVLDVADLRYVAPDGVVQIDGVSFQVRGGEIYAIAGVQGNGQTELTRILLGLDKPTAGSISIDGKDIAGLDVDARLALGVGFVPEDRLHDGLVGDYSVAENLVLDLYKRPPYGRRFSIDLAAVNANAEHRISEFDVRTQSASASASTLSGGNQQKVVLAREMSRPLKLLIVSQPTRGLDVGSMEFVHRRLVVERDTGTAIVLVSTELEEVLGLADRIAVMYRGQILAEVPGGSSAETVGLLMAGSVPEDLAERDQRASANAATETGTGPDPATGKGEAESA